LRYAKSMADLKFEVPSTEAITVDAETLAAIDRGIKHGDEGRTFPMDHVQKLIPEWISKFESQKPR
jgi:predicted transcriptional regulator